MVIFSFHGFKSIQTLREASPGLFSHFYWDQLSVLTGDNVTYLHPAQVGKKPVKMIISSPICLAGTVGVEHVLIDMFHPDEANCIFTWKYLLWHELPVSSWGKHADNYVHLTFFPKFKSNKKYVLTYVTRYFHIVAI